MSNITSTPAIENANGTWSCTVTYTYPDVNGCDESYKTFKLTANSEQELGIEFTELVISLKNS